jgi:chemotaxis signal transduction protein
MLNLTLQSAKPQSIPVAAPECKAIAFSICGYCLSLPISAIVRVLPVTASAVFSNRNGGFTQIDGYPTVLLDLHPLFAQLRYSKNSQAQFLAIARIDTHTLCAIPIDEPPTLIDIPLNTVEPLPYTYRQSLERVASHIVNITQNNETTTVFLLDLKGAMQALFE